MDGITLGQVVETLAWIVGAVGVVAGAGKMVSNAFNKALEKALEPVNDKIDAVNKKMDELEAKHDQSDMSRVKDFLVEFLARVERGEAVDEEELERFWENYDFYDDHGGNSYVHGKVEKLKKMGKL